jgi:hypothetical protein
MLARVNTARSALDRRALDRRASASRLRLERRRKVRPADPAAPRTEKGRETQAMKQVFRDLGVTYRRHRSQIGGPVATGLRAATDGFRAKQSFQSLVAVAAILDQLDLLS